MAEQVRPRRRRVLVAATTTAAVGGLLVSLAATAPAASAAPKCTVDFTSSTDHPAVGQNITLRWTSSGADQIVASWTTMPVAAHGTQVTTKDAPGPVSFQVTGLKSGQYCGGAVVNVVFTAAVSSAAGSSAPSTPATSATAVASPTSTAAPASASPSVTYPAQSPTGGSSTPWYEQPLDLLVLGLLSLFGSVALFNRDRVRALFARRH